MPATLNIGRDGFKLPLGWMQLATVVYGARGSGKTMLGRTIAEEVNAAGQRFVAVDLKGDWHGLQSTADGTGKGIAVVIFGGDHADLPLEEGSGRFVGELVAGIDQSCVVDLEHLSKGKQTRWLADFFEALYEKNREPLLCLLDEAQRYAPQLGGRAHDPQIARCLGAVEDLVKLGRKHGLGIVLFTQRGAGLNKEVSELCDMLVAFRTPGPLDQERIRTWLEANATREQQKDVMGRLAGLQTGTAVFASAHPQLPLTVTTVAVRPAWTFDSSATPEIGKRRREPKVLAKADLAKLREKMKDAIARKELADPKVLRRALEDRDAEVAAYQERLNVQGKRIRELEVELEAALAAASAVDVAAIRENIDALLDAAGAQLVDGLKEDIATFFDHARTAVHAFGKAPRAPTPAALRESIHLPAAKLRPDFVERKGWDAVEEEQYQKWKARLVAELRQEAPALVKLLATSSELEVTVDRRRVEVGDSSLRGRVGKLIAQGFFASSQKAGPTRTELVRTGPDCNTANIGRELNYYRDLGLLTCESDGYRIAPGAKARIVEAR